MAISGPPIHDSLWAAGSHQDEDVMVRQRNRAYINEELFLEDILNVFIPYVANLRVQFGNETAILMMDSALPHISERMLRFLCQNKIMDIVFPAHITNIFRALDLVFLLLSRS
jgi:hypothetical protein